MLESDFRNYLRNATTLKETTIRARIASCRRVERCEGDLDQHFDSDQCRGLLWRLTYSAEDRNQERPPKHNIPINGNVVTGSATLKRAIILYVQFRGSSGTSAKRFPSQVETASATRLYNNDGQRILHPRGGREANREYELMSGSGCLIAALWAIVVIASLILVVAF